MFFPYPCLFNKRYMPDQEVSYAAFQPPAPLARGSRQAPVVEGGRSPVRALSWVNQNWPCHVLTFKVFTKTQTSFWCFIWWFMLSTSLFFLLFFENRIIVQDLFDKIYSKSKMKTSSVRFCPPFLFRRSPPPPQRAGRPTARCPELERRSPDVFTGQIYVISQCYIYILHNL